MYHPCKNIFSSFGDPVPLSSCVWSSGCETKKHRTQKNRGPEIFREGLKGQFTPPKKYSLGDPVPQFSCIWSCMNRKDIGLGNIEGPYLFSVKFADKSANLVEKSVHTLKLENNTMNIVGLFREVY